MRVIFQRAIIGLIKLMPRSVRLVSYRVYVRALKAFGPEFVAETYFKARLYCNPLDLIQRMIFHFGIWEPNVSKVVEANLLPGDVFIDIGANIGYHSLLASWLVGDTGKVVAIEASRRAFSMLTRNLTLNETGNVRAVNIAVSDKVSKVDIYEVSKHNIGAATTLLSRGGLFMESVETLPLDSILTPAEISRVRLIKIDIEGAEPPVLRRLLDTLSLYPREMDVIVEASPDDDHGSWIDIFTRLKQAGFSGYAIENSYDIDWYLSWRKPTPLQKVEAIPNRQQDLLFTRRDAPLSVGGAASPVNRRTTRVKPEAFRALNKFWSRWQYRRQNTETLRSHLKMILQTYRIDTVIDVGANEGQFGSLLRELGFMGDIHSCEPIKKTYDQLLEASERDHRWTAHNIGLGRKPGTVTMNVSQASVFSSVLRPNAFGLGKFEGIEVQHQDEVEVSTLDIFIKQHIDDRAERIFLKMDTQGYDREVFEGGIASRDMICGILSELSFIPIYEGMPSYMEVLTAYEAGGFSVTGLYPVNRNDDLALIEVDCVLVDRRRL